MVNYKLEDTPKVDDYCAVIELVYSGKSPRLDLRHSTVGSAVSGRPVFPEPNGSDPRPPFFGRIKGSTEPHPCVTPGVLEPRSGLREEVGGKGQRVFP